MVLRLADSAVLVVSVYVPCYDAGALRRTIRLLGRLIKDVREHLRTWTDVVLAGDFNRLDQLCGWDDYFMARQGDADPVIDLMNEHALVCLLPRGTKTWQSGDRESTIDIILASDEFVTTVL